MKISKPLVGLLICLFVFLSVFYTVKIDADGGPYYPAGPFYDMSYFPECPTTQPNKAYWFDIDSGEWGCVGTPNSRGYVQISNDGTFKLSNDLPGQALVVYKYKQINNVWQWINENSVSDSNLFNNWGIGYYDGTQTSGKWIIWSTANYVRYPSGEYFSNSNIENAITTTTTTTITTTETTTTQPSADEEDDGGLFGGFFDWLKKIWEAITGIPTFIKGLFDGLIELIKELFDLIKDFFIWLFVPTINPFESIADMFNSRFYPLKLFIDIFKDAFNFIVSNIGSLPPELIITIPSIAGFPVGGSYNIIDFSEIEPYMGLPRTFIVAWSYLTFFTNVIRRIAGYSKYDYLTKDKKK